LNGEIPQNARNLQVQGEQFPQTWQAKKTVNDGDRFRDYLDALP
jgi:sigma54-dependent transcription regulator